MELSFLNNLQFSNNVLCNIIVEGPKTTVSSWQQEKPNGFANWMDWADDEHK